MQTDMDAWWQSKTGAYLQKQERAALDQALPTIFGYYLVQAGCWWSLGGVLESSPIRTRVVVGAAGTPSATVVGDPLYLPFQSDAVDAVLLPHTLERVSEPEQVLREAERVLRGEGHLIVLGFHPWSAWGMRRYLGPAPVWSGRFLRLARLSEWLTVLGFETVSVRHLLFRPPWQQRSLLVRSAFLDRLAWRLLAGAYVIVARKRVFSMTPLMARQRARPQRAFGSMVKPTTRGLP